MYFAMFTYSECRLHQDSIFKLMPHATALLVDLEDGVVDLSKKQEKHQQNVWELFQVRKTMNMFSIRSLW